MELSGFEILRFSKILRIIWNQFFFFFFCDRITMEYLTKQSSKHEGKPWELKTLSWNQWNDQRALKIVKKYYKNKKCSNIRCFFITMRGF